MRRLLPLAALLAAASLLGGTPARAAYQPRLITAEDARADIALMRRALDTIHPGLTRYTDKPTLEAAYRRLEAATARPITDLALHAEVARLLATIRCDHTKPELSETLMQYREVNATHLPFRFRLLEGRMIVVAADGQPGAPTVGSEILAINGTTVPALLLKIAPLVAYDGTTDQAIAAKLGEDSDLMGDDLNEYHPSLFGFVEHWQVSWKPVGGAGANTATLRPIGFRAWTELKAPGARYRSEFYNGITWRMSGKVARLQVDTFVNYRNPVQPTAFLGGFFQSLAAAGTDHLILDLRNNGGGSEDASVALGRYLIPQPFLWSKPIRYRTVRIGELASHIETWGDREARFNPPMDAFTRTPDGWYERIPTLEGRDLSDGDSTFVQQPVVAGAFRGRLTILSGPRNGSGATRTIAQLKEKAAATLIGEDSAGSAEGPTAGSVFLLKLPASGLKVRIPEAWNRTNISSWVPGKGVPVDHLVVPTLADFQAGRDRALDVARTGPPAVADPGALAASALSGHWAGTLDYRDYRTDARVTLPTRLDSDGRALAFTYEDGPGKTVRSAADWTFDPARRSFVITTRGFEGKGAAETWRVAEAHAGADGAITLVLDGELTENGRTRVARTVLTRSGNLLRLTRMTRSPGEPFLMRHSYELFLRPTESS
jgi:hypothetical protein